MRSVLTEMATMPSGHCSEAKPLAYGDDALGTLLGGEAAGVLEALVGEGREVEAALVHVAEPGAAGEGEHGLGALHSDLEEFDWPRAQVPVAIGLEFGIESCLILILIIWF